MSTETEPGFLTDLLATGIGKIADMFQAYQRNMALLIRQPSPLKITVNLTADANGLIGGGFANPNPVLVYEPSMAHEVWINRIAITSPSGQPKTPLTTGQLMIQDGMGTPILFLPVGGSVAPVLVTEGRLSAHHLSYGGRIVAFGDSFTANTSLRIDLQMILVTGVSAGAPWMHENHKVLD